ncbi:MAG: hypothetical protein U0232_23380 [Thermomicrobiales bacterium]
MRAIEDAGALARENDGWALSDLAVVGVPPLLRQVIDARIDRLGEDARRLLAVAAVVGQETSLLLWATIAGVEEDILLGLVERAAEARVLMPTADGARFTHALIREALYDGMLPLRRRAWHRLIGEALSTQPRADPDAVAYQFRQAGDPRAVAWLDRAAERAFRAYAWISAVDRLEAALPLLEMAEMGAEERAWLLYRLARLLRLSDPERGLRYLEVAAPLAAGSGAAALAAYITFDRGRLAGGMITRYQHRILADMAEGIAALEALPDTERVVRGGREELWLADALSAEDPTGAFAAASHTTIGMNIRLGTFVVWLGWFGRYAEALALGEQALAETAAHIPGNVYAVISAADAHQGLGYTHAAQGRPEAARAALRQSGSLNLLIGHHMLAALALIRELDMVTLVYATDDPAARERLAGQIEQALVRASGLYAEHRAPRAYRVPLLYLAGHWAEARAVAQVPENYLTWLGMIDHARGDRSDAWRLVQDALPAGPATEPGGMPLIPALGLQRLAAALALDEGDLSSAREWLEAHDRWLAWSDAILGRAEGCALWSRYHRAAGDLAAAREAAERALAHAAEPRQPLGLLAAHRLLGELDAAAGRQTDAAAQLDQALALAASYERALTLLALAELDQATEGRRNCPLVPGRSTHDSLRARCAAPALVRADVLLARLDASARRPPRLARCPLRTFGAGAGCATADRRGSDRCWIARATLRRSQYRQRAPAGIYGKLGVNTRAAAALAVDHRLA